MMFSETNKLIVDMYRYHLCRCIDETILSCVVEFVKMNGKFNRFVTTIYSRLNDHAYDVIYFVKCGMINNKVDHFYGTYEFVISKFLKLRPGSVYGILYTDTRKFIKYKLTHDIVSY